MTQSVKPISGLPQESLSEKMQRERLTVSELLKQYGVHLGSWLLSTGLAFGCAAGIYFLCQYEQQVGERRSWRAATKELQVFVDYLYLTDRPTDRQMQNH